MKKRLAIWIMGIALLMPNISFAASTDKGEGQKNKKTASVKMDLTIRELALFGKNARLPQSEKGENINHSPKKFYLGIHIVF
ncbi:MAG: hypothetical protein HY466_07600 [Deltaproteobacteria bacterium]|nr:hypothetical protein [Deltaproteobacteria bacterium]